MDHAWELLAIEVLMHDGGICALGQLSALLDTALVEDARYSQVFPCQSLLLIIGRLLVWHDKFFDLRLGKFVLDFLLELD